MLAVFSLKFSLTGIYNKFSKGLICFNLLELCIFVCRQILSENLEKWVRTPTNPPQQYMQSEIQTIVVSFLIFMGDPFLPPSYDQFLGPNGTLLCGSQDYQGPCKNIQIQISKSY